MSMNESGCPCADHATACAGRNRGRKIRADIGVCSQQFARALGIEVLPGLLSIADEVFE
jgi:hypothetical protein